MKVFKHLETGQIVKEFDPNHYSIYERFGYVEIKEEKVNKPKKRKVNK